jgi:hypothetical protein
MLLGNNVLDVKERIRQAILGQLAVFAAVACTASNQHPQRTVH